ncbi:MAG: transketolase C-terminal domain-containing protein [Pseudomonadota bacterium]
MRDTFVQTLESLLPEHQETVLITGDLGFGVLTAPDDEAQTRFGERHPQHFINAGVAEQNMTAIAAGMALQGFKAWTYSIGNFPTLRALEQIRNDICYHDANVTIVAIGGGFSYGQLGMSHFATEDLAIIRALPNMKVLAPCEKWEVTDLVTELCATPGPAYLRIDKSHGGVERRDGEQAKIGKARMVRDGSDGTLIACGGILSEAMIAADRLAEQGLSMRILSMHTIKPLDVDAVLSASRETGGIVSVEEHNVIGGLGSAIAETCLSEGTIPSYFHRIGLADHYPTIVGDQDYLRAQYGMNADAIVAAVLDKLGDSSEATVADLVAAQ